MQPTDQVAAPVITEEPRKRTLEELVSALAQMERSLDDPDFDPAALVGDLKLDLEHKIDGIDFVIREYRAYAERTKERGNLLLDRARSAANRAERLKNYVWATMKAEGFERLNGKERFVYVKKLGPVVVTTRPPTPQDFIALGPDVVKMTPELFNWRLPELARMLKQPNVELEFAKLEENDTVIFEERDTPAVGQKKKAKK